MKFAASVLNAAWVAAQTPEYLRFRRALGRVNTEQEARLFYYLRVNARTEFGRRHGFDTIRSVREYQDRVPLSTYEDYEPSIERIRSGEHAVLTVAPVRCLEPSSGSTRAAKLIPYTRDLQAEFSRALAPWIFDLARSTPQMMGGPAYWCITPAVTAPRANSDTSVVAAGFESDSAYLGGRLQWLTDRTLVNCNDLKHAGDLADFRRRTLLRLLNERELRLISVWHPTFLTLLFDAMAASWRELLHDLTRGLPPAGPVRGSPPNPSRASELARADPLRPRSIWPRLAIVSCWGDGHAATLMGDLQARLPGIRIQPKGLIATEALVSLPFAGRHPLAIRSHLFEFLDSRGNARCAWELERGQSYSLVVTTGGGLYRYQLRDRILVQDFLQETPCIRFMGKEDGIADLCGEKLNEAMVGEVLSRLLPSLAPGAKFALLAPSTHGGRIRYVLYLDSARPAAARLCDELEAALSANPNYAHCVRLGQLLPATVEHVGSGAAERYLERLRESGQRLGNIKPAALSPLTGWDRILAP